MAGRNVFYSFHFDNDVMRVQLIRNMGVIVGNQEVTPQRWEEVKRSGEVAVQKWIDDNMKNKSCVVVLIGSETSERPWVKYEILKAYTEKKPLFGIYIHNLKCAKTRNTCAQGKNPFDGFSWDDNEKVSKYIRCYNPNPANAYRDIEANITNWIEAAIADLPNRR